MLIHISTKTLLELNVMNVKARFSETKDKNLEYTIQAARQVLSTLPMENYPAEASTGKIALR